MSGPQPRLRAAMRWGLAAFYALAAYAHLKSPDAFLPIMPDFVPAPRFVVLATGWCELDGAFGLLAPHLRRAAGIGLALYAICVFPANIKHALEGIELSGVTLDWRYHVPRLAMQPAFVWMALFAAGLVDWPWRRTVNRQNDPDSD